MKDHRIDFAKYYRDKLNLEQKRKMKIIINEGLKIKSGNNFVKLNAVLELFDHMAKRGYSWEKIQERLNDELLLKGLLDE